jgi:formate hydrogenlyase subunit 6/NADH:ubiquinone oxidoreductase subunit I
MHWQSFIRSISSVWKGMRLTMLHLLRARRRRNEQDIRKDAYFAEEPGLSTLLYPFETIPLPEHARYLLHNEIEDCIVCDKCAKICPVNCIEIEPIRSSTEFGKTSDGTARRIYAGRFDIDMAKCCFCGLCTTVCPTECLIMTPEYDVPVLNLEKLNFGFGNLTEEEADLRRREWEEEKTRKESAKIRASAASESVSPEQSGPESEAGNPAQKAPPGAPPVRRPMPFPRPSRPKDDNN